jgi:hypothetical protein
MTVTEQPRQNAHRPTDPARPGPADQPVPVAGPVGARLAEAALTGSHLADGSRRAGRGVDHLTAAQRPPARRATLDHVLRESKAGREGMRCRQPAVALQILHHSKIAVPMEGCTDVPSEATRRTAQARQAPWEARSEAVAVLRCCTACQSPYRESPAGALSCVDLRGFEPLAPSMRTRCATGLRHRPLQRVKL